MLSMSMIDVTDQEFEEKVIKSSTPVVVDFWAPWCGPCKMAEPILDELSKQHEGKVVFAKVNVDENQQTAGKYGVMSIPTTILFKGGKEEGRQIGFAGKKAFEDLISKVI